ncbi:MAG: ribonucleotide reductase N-terminal alpha domain-containing protein, partial [Mariprofundales bacterium]|nr:ribonucleotide reductase N-terminal alpha domain-containing protein [Mariprofundales bacterium]
MSTLDRQRKIWEDRYALRNPDSTLAESGIEDTWDRVAGFVAGGDPDDVKRFRAILDGFQFVPAGRILAGAGLGRRATLANCFVLPIKDTREGIFRTLGHA